MNQANRSFPELDVLTGRFTIRTRGRLARALVRSLRSRAHSLRGPLDDAVREAIRELRAEGLDDRAILAFFGNLVEDAGRACGADRPSLMSGELGWVPVRARVLEFVRSALGGLANAAPGNASQSHVDETERKNFYARSAG